MHDETKESEPCTPYRDGATAIVSDEEDGNSSDGSDDNAALKRANQTIAIDA